MPIKRATEIATIDVEMFVVRTKDNNGYAIDTASQVAVEAATETQDPVKLIVKGRLKAQKKGKVTITGTSLTITDNVFTPEVVQILQGGRITYSESEPTKITGYEPPAADSVEEPEVFEADVYTTQYDTAGNVVQYEKTTFPNCTGKPIAFNFEDGVFRAPSYTIDSAPSKGQPPYKMAFVDTLPELG